MENLFAYVIFGIVGYDIWGDFGELLDAKIIEEPDNNDFIILEGTTNLSEITRYCVDRCEYLIQSGDFNNDEFEEEIKVILRKIYNKVELDKLVRDMFEVYRTIPHNAGGSKLMEVLFYAEDYYEVHEDICRKMIESTIFEGESF